MNHTIVKKSRAQLVDQRAYKRIQVNVSSLPASVPSGSVCNVREVRHLEDLKCGDLVLVLTNGAYRPRRFFRSSGEWAWLGGDSTNISTQSYSGDILKVFEIYKGGNPLKVKHGGLRAIVKWIGSFL